MSAYDQTARIFKAFCDPNRLRILTLLQDGERCACELLEDLHISQSTLSHHMRILNDAGVITGRKVGKWTHYTLNRSGLDTAIQALTTMRQTAASSQTANRR